jgi:hypothetical protein
MDAEHREETDGVALGFGKAAAFVLAGYFVMKVIGLAQTNAWSYLSTGYGLWFLVELLGFVLLPCYFSPSERERRTLRSSAAPRVWAVLGIVLNRFNVGLIAFNYHLPSASAISRTGWKSAYRFCGNDRRA